MATPRFCQIHYLTSYPASLLNRDDAGFAKRMPFGEATRTRISSQCLKRHWRTFSGEYALSSFAGDESMSIRSRYIFSDKIAKPLKERFDPQLVDLVVSGIAAGVLGLKQEEKKTKAGKEETGEEREQLSEDKKKKKAGLRTNQLVVLGYPEVAYLRNLAEALCEKCQEGGKPDSKAIKDQITKEGLKNLNALGRGAGLDAALFGRMKTSDQLADCDASVYVAHAFTVHREQSETDYFTAVDDLLGEVEAESSLGAAHINATELTSGLYYGYVVVDLPLLISNLEGCPTESWEQTNRTRAARVVEHLLHLIAKVSPGAKLGSTAPFSYAQFLAVEQGDAQPTTWANAFFHPVPLKDTCHQALVRLDEHICALDRIYAPGNARRYVSLSGDPLKAMESAVSFHELVSWAGSGIRGA